MCERSKARKGKLLHRKEVVIEEIKIYVLRASTLLVLFLVLTTVRPRFAPRFVLAPHENFRRN